MGKFRDVWKAEKAIRIPAGQTISQQFDVSGIFESCDIAVNSQIKAGGTRYRAAKLLGVVNGEFVTTKKDSAIEGSAGGMESYLRVQVVPNGLGGTIYITNTSTSEIVTVDGTGAPYFVVWGRAFHDTRFSTQESPVIVREDTESIAQFGINEVEVNLTYLTDESEAGNLGDYLLLRYSALPETIEGVKIIADPRLEVGDRVAVDYPPLGIDAEYWIQGISDQISPMGGYEQTLTLAIADRANWFILDDSILDGSAILSY
jgi:hypothetical protein